MSRIHVCFVMEESDNSTIYHDLEKDRADLVIHESDSCHLLQETSLPSSEVRWLGLT